MNASLPSSNIRIQAKLLKFCLLGVLLGTQSGRNLSLEGNRWLLVIPRYLRKQIVQSLHNHLTAGHLGLQKTHDPVKRRYFWPKMYQTAFQHVRPYLECKQRKSSNTEPAGLLQTSAYLNTPWPLASLIGGCRWIGTAVDHLSRNAVTAVLRSAAAEEVAHFFI